MKSLFPVQVEGDELPLRFTLGARALEIVDIVDRWLGPDARHFKVQADDGDTYILRYDLDARAWELTLFCRRDYLGGGPPKQEQPFIPGH